jgi:hypothetical protein
LGRLALLLGTWALASGCNLLGSHEQPDLASFEGVQTFYQSGEPIEATLVNSSDRPLHVLYHCTYVGVDKLTQQGWVGLYQERAVCPQIFSSKMEAGERRSRVVPYELLQQVTEVAAGTYRLKSEVYEADDWEGRWSVYSRAFEVR